MSPLASIAAADVTTIAAEVFAAMIDGQSGGLTPWQGVSPRVVDPLYAWVDLHTEPMSRVQLSSEAGTAGHLARALLRADAAEPVAEADVVDAFGEIANVLGGGIKALLPAHVEITMPGVSRRSPSPVDAVQLHEVWLAWRSRPLVISLWRI